MSILSRLLLLVSLSLSACAPVVTSTPPPPSRSSQAFVIAANPLAAEAGREVLARGGSAAESTNRELVALKFYAGLTNREIADVIRESESNVGTRLSRIIRHLRSAL